MKIPLQGKSKKFAIIDEEDFGEVCWYKWYEHSAGYAVRTYMKNYKSYSVYMHREIMSAAKYVDHVNGNPLDNRKVNLRLCTQQENTRNKKISTSNTSGYKGVYWNTQRGKWFGKINHRGKQYHLGCFDDPIEAARAYNVKAFELFGDFARPNVLD